MIKRFHVIENGHFSNPESIDSKMIFKEVNMNVDSELEKKAQEKGIDLSKTLEQQLRRMV